MTCGDRARAWTPGGAPDLFLQTARVWNYPTRGAGSGDPRPRPSSGPTPGAGAGSWGPFQKWGVGFQDPSTPI